MLRQLIEVDEEVWPAQAILHHFSPLHTPSSITCWSCYFLHTFTIVHTIVQYFLSPIIYSWRCKFTSVAFSTTSYSLELACWFQH